MPKIIGYVQTMNGEYKAISPDNSERVLALGSPVYEDETVQSDGNPDSIIVVSLEESEDEITLVGEETLLFEASLTEEGFADEELVFEDDDYFASVVAGIESLDEVETEAGEENDAETADDVALVFKDRDGNEVDVNSGLRDARFKTEGIPEKENLETINVATSQSYSEIPDYTPGSPDSVFDIPGRDIPEPPTPTTPPTPPTPPAPPTPPTTVTPPTIVPEIIINDVTVNEEDGTMTFIVTASESITTDITFNYSSADNSAIDGIDYSAVNGVATILAGETTTTITVPIIDDYFAEEDETYFINLSGISSNATIADEQGIGTILDRPANSVEVKLVPTDIDGNIIPEVTIPEGEVAYYKAILVDENGDEIVGATGDVDITFTDGTAVRTGTIDNGELDFNANDATVAINEVFSAVAENDIIGDSGEKFNVQITDGTYTESDKYESVIHDTTPVVTTIIDDVSTDNSITVKLVSTDAAGNIIPEVTIPEGATAYYKAILVDTDGNEIPGATGDVEITFEDGTAVRTGTGPDGKNDFSATDAFVTINSVFSAVAKDDPISDSGEKFTVRIVDNTYTEADKYESVNHDLTPVTTTITDDSGTPDIPDDGPEADHEVVIIKLVALNTDGSPILDGSGHYTFANEVYEGNDAKYMPVAFTVNETIFSPATQLPVQVGTVDVTFANGTAIGANPQTADDGSEDFNNTAQATVTLGQPVTTATLDDIMGDNDETYTISITAGSYAADANGGYENVEIDTSPVTTTILDDTDDTSGNPDDPGTPPADKDTPPSPENPETNHEIVIIKLVALNTDETPVLDVNGHYTFANEVHEGNDAKYMPVAFAPGETVFSPTTQLPAQVGTIDVTFANGTAIGTNPQTVDDGSEDFNNTAQTTVTLGQPITTATFDDIMGDTGETYTISITAGSYAADVNGGYENVEIDTSPVTTTILDDTGTPDVPNDGPEPDHEAVIIKLVACDASGNPILVDDGNGNITKYTFVNTGQEGGVAQYMPVAFGPNETEFTTATAIAPNGTVDVTFSDGATGTPAQDATGAATQDTTVATDIDGSKDYDNDGQTVAVGVAFSTDLFDDYLKEGNHDYTVTITSGSYTPPTPTTGYENVTESGSVVTTISDDEAGGGGTPPGDETPNEPIDSVYVKLINDDTQAEGSDLTHRVELVDKNGDPITVAAGETITVTLSYSPNTTDDGDGHGLDGAESEDYIADLSVDIVGGTSFTDFTNKALTDFFDEAIEQYDVTITGVAQANDTYENILPNTIANGASSDDISAIGTITNVNQSVSPDNAYVDESDFSPLNTNDLVGDRHDDDNLTPLDDTDDTITSNPTKININTELANDEYKFVFENSVIMSNDSGANQALTSNGHPITTAVSADGSTITGTANGVKIFDIVLSTGTDDSGADDGYVYTQYANIDHPTTTGTDAQTDDTLTMEFGFKIKATNGTDESSIQNFTVTVDDSIPQALNETFNVNEDDTEVIVISDESFAGGDITLNNGSGDVVVATNGTIEIKDADGNDTIGTLLNKGDGTLEFTPYPDYSGATSGFTYTVTDSDGDSATGTIGLKVVPESDAPTIANGGTSTDEDTAVTININAPVVKDDTDQNNNIIDGATAEDYPELLGLISLDNMNSGVEILKGSDDSVLWTSTGTDSKLYVLLSDGDHTTDTIAAFVPDANHITMTTAEFEALKVNPVAQDHRDIDIQMHVTEYEVDASGNILPDGDVVGTNGSTTNKTFHVEVEAVTDPIALTFDSELIDGLDVGTIDDPTHFTHNTLTEGVNTIDLKQLLTSTTGNSVDSLDGSEYRSYIISGVPEGTIAVFGDKSATADSSGTLTISPSWFNDTNEDVAFTMTLPEHFSGSVTAEITLSVHDTDSDTNETVTTETATVYFNVDVNPVADDVTLQVAQATGNEDAGRTDSNTENVNADVIDAPADGIPLNIKASSDDKDGSETFTVTISSIPTGAKIFYNGSEVSQSPAGTVTIATFDNNAPLSIVPNHNDDSNFTLDISAKSVDGASEQVVSQPLTIDVDVKGVADIPVNDTLATTSVMDKNGASHDFTITAVEDTNGNSIDLKTIFANPAGLDSYDADGSETLTMKVTGVDAGFDIVGATLITGIGENRIWFVDVDELKAGNVTLERPSDFAGEMDFQVQFITTEQEGDSATHPVKDVSLMVTPATDTSSMTSNDNQDEDESKTLTFGFGSTDIDGAPAGIETLETFSIDVTGLEAAGITLTSNGVDISTGKSGHQSVTVVNGVPSVVAVLDEDSHLNGSYDFKISYTYLDTAIDDNGNEYTDTATVTDEDYSVNVTAVTDDIDLSMTTTTGANNSVDGSGNVTVSDNGIFTKTLNIIGLDSDNRGSLDEDGSEEVTRVTVSGVPEGITVGGSYGVYAGDTDGGNYSGFWYVDIPNQALDGSTSYDLEFDVDGSFTGAEIDTYTITVTAFNEDNNNGIEQNDSETFDLTIDQAITGTTGTPANILGFYQDIDNDMTQDHDNGGMTDTDAYAQSVLREDTPFQLSDVIHVEIEDTNAGLNDFALTIKNVPPGVTIDGMTYNSAGDFYTYSGHGNPQAVVDALQAITVTPSSNDNTDASDIGATDLAFDIELTTYATGGGSNTELINFTGSVLPVTDVMNLSVVNDGSTLEDTDQTFSITMDNDADGANTIIVDGKVYLQVTENYTDTLGTDGTAGTLKDGSGVALTTTAVSGVAGVADGDYYVIENVDYNDTLDFIYTPAEDRNGSVSVTATVKNIEGEGWNPFNTTELVSTQTVSFNVVADVDGHTLDSTANRVGLEDNLVALDIQVSNPDSSETLTSISLDGVPDGFLVFYGEAADGSDKTQAQNIGANGTTNIEMMYGTPENVVANLWNIPLNGGNVPTYTWIQAPENWSGTIPTMDVNVIDGDGNTTTSSLNVEITPVVDSLTLNTTKTFGNAGEDIELKLNANIQDLDGSETVKLELTGLGIEAVFKANGVEIDPANVSYDSNTNTHTIINIAAVDINALTVVNFPMNADVSVNAYMVESDGSQSAVVNQNPNGDSLDFNVNIGQSVATSGDDTLYYDGTAIDGLDGTDTVVLKQDADLTDIDFSKIENVEVLDLTENGDHDLADLDLAEVVGMTDSNDELVIEGDAGDSVELDGGDYDASTNAEGWQSTDNGADTTYTSTDGSDAGTVKIDDAINTNIV